MKNLKKISLISFLACASLAGGILMANTEAPAEPVKEFKMVEGAQIRVPDGELGSLEKDGLRFTATMTDAYRESIGELEELSVGMFIYPAVYAEGRAVNEANCFGENACYYWAGKEVEDTTGKKQILNVECYAYEEVEGADYLTMKASVWNLDESSLDREFEAVAYAYNKTTDTYYFAQTAEGAKAVSVAQKALLNAEDEIHMVEGGADKVNEAYVVPYLGEEGVEVSYKETAYKQQKDGSYVVVEENADKTGVVKAYDTQAVKAFDNYAVYSRQSGDRTLLIDGSANITTYYNYAGNRVVLWDGDENVAPETYLKTQSGSDIQAFRIENKSIYEGNYGWVYNVDGWDGPSWPTGKVLPVATDTLSAVLEVESDYAGWTVGFYTGVKTGWVSVTAITLENLVTGEVTEGGAEVDIPAGLYKVTMKFEKAVSVITSIGFRVKLTDGCPVTKIDNICAENIKVVGTPDVANIYTDTISFNAPEIIDTTAWEGENDSIAVQYKSNLASEYSDLTAQDGVYTITPDASAYKYEIVINGQSYTTVKGVSLINFDVPVEERDYIATISKSNSGIAEDNASAEGVKEGLTIQEMDGKNMLCTAASGWWIYVNKKASASTKDVEVVAGFTPTKIGVWVYAPNATTVDIYNYGNQGNDQYGAERNVAIEAGYQYVEFTFAKSLAGTYAVGFNFGSAKSLYVYEIVLIA